MGRDLHPPFRPEEYQRSVIEWGDIPGFHELHAAVSLARTKHLMGAQEEKIVLSAAQLSRRRIEEIILPARDISMIPSGLSLAEALVRAHMDLHTRFPICAEEGNPADDRRLHHVQGPGVRAQDARGHSRRPKGSRARSSASPASP